jgi:hypothetical protein
VIVKLSDDAEQDLLDGIAFYDQHGRQVGDYFLDSITADLRSLCILGGVHAKRYGYHCMGAKWYQRLRGTRLQRVSDPQWWAGAGGVWSVPPLGTVFF